MLQCNLKYNVVLFPKSSRLKYIYAAYLISYKNLRTLLHNKGKSTVIWYNSPRFIKANKKSSQRWMPAMVMCTITEMSNLAPRKAFGVWLTAILISKKVRKKGSISYTKKLAFLQVLLLCSLLPEMKQAYRSISAVVVYWY